MKKENESQLLVLEEKNLQLVVNEQTLGTLKTNAEQIRDLVKNAAGQYKAENYSEGNIDVAKADKTKLNKAKKALNDERIRLEKAFNAPFEEFKAIVNEAVGYITEAVAQIDIVIKDVDEKTKKQKREECEKVAEKCGLEEVGIKLDLIWNDKWLNKSTSLKAVEKEINERIAQFKADLDTLKSFAEDYDTLVVRYKEKLDLNATVAYANQLKEAREARKAAEQPKPESEQEQPGEVKIAGDNRPFAVVKEPEPTQEKESQHISGNEMDAADAFAAALGQGTVAMPTEPMFTRGFKVTGTKQQLGEIAEFMKSNGIHFESIEV